MLDAIDRRAWDELRAELGDFMLEAVFFAQMASEEELFDIGDSLDAINETLIRAMAPAPASRSLPPPETFSRTPSLTRASARTIPAVPRAGVMRLAGC